MIPMAIEDTLLRQRKVLAEFGELALASDDLEHILDQACRLVSEALDTNLAKFTTGLSSSLADRSGSGAASGWAPP